MSVREYSNITIHCPGETIGQSLTHYVQAISEQLGGYEITLVPKKLNADLGIYDVNVQRHGVLFSQMVDLEWKQVQCYLDGFLMGVNMSEMKK